MPEPLITADEFMTKYAHLQIELTDGRVTLSGRPIEFVEDRMRCFSQPDAGATGCGLKKPPQMCVEVQSASNTWVEIYAKVGDCLRAGVTVVLVLDPDTRTASVYRGDSLQEIFRADDELTLPDVLPGFSVPVRRFFA